jgi:hypothetical protein
LARDKGDLLNDPRWPPSDARQVSGKRVLRLLRQQGLLGRSGVWLLGTGLTLLLDDLAARRSS